MTGLYSEGMEKGWQGGSVWLQDSVPYNTEYQQLTDNMLKLPPW